MRTLRDIPLNTLALKPETPVALALQAMQRANLAAAAVTDGMGLRGIVTIEAAVLSDTDATVASVMRGASNHLEADQPVRTAAKSFVNQKADFVAVFDGEEYLGLLSALSLITELGSSWDPLTGLSWSDRLRDWGVDCLESGQEIGIVFFDLNDFGAYNKQFGHIVGDRVLRGFAQFLSELADPELDVLVRYGGDEFVLATKRKPRQMKELISRLGKLSIDVEGVEQPVGFCFGISGGKRHNEPSRTHVAATLDNLINLASRACLAKKPGADRATEPEPTAVLTQELAIEHWKKLSEKAAANATDENTKVVVSDTVFLAGEAGTEVFVAGTVETLGASQVFVATRPVNGSPEDALFDAVQSARLS